MRFLVEWRLFLLVGVGALAGAWVAAAVRRRRDVVRFTNVELLDVIAPRDPGWRRHLPAVLFLVALAALVIGFARPVRATRVGDEHATVLLALDTSLSMEADDVEPNRLAVAQEAAPRLRGRPARPARGRLGHLPRHHHRGRRPHPRP